VLRSTEDVHDVNSFWHLKQRRVRLLSQGTVNFRIYRNDAVILRLHVGGDPMAGTHRTVGKSNHRNRVRAPEQVTNGIGIRQGSHAGIVVLRLVRKPLPKARCGWGWSLDVGANVPV